MYRMLYTIAPSQLRKISLNQCDLDLQQIEGIKQGIMEGLKQRQLIDSNMIQMAELRSGSLVEVDMSENARINPEAWFELIQTIISISANTIQKFSFKECWLDDSSCDQIINGIQMGLENRR